MIRRTVGTMVVLSLFVGMALAAEDAKDDWVVKVEKAFEQKVSFKLDGASLEATLELIQKSSGVSIVLDPAVAKASGDTKISLTVKDMPVRRALGLVLKLAGLRYILQDGVVFVSSRQRLVVELLSGGDSERPVVESRPLTVPEAMVATSGLRGLGADIEDLGNPFANIHSRPWRLPEAEYRDARTGLMQFPAPPVWIASPYENQPRHRFTKEPYFLKPQYLAEFYYGNRADSSRTVRREMVGRLAALLRANPDWTAKDILEQLQMLELAQ